MSEDLVPFKLASAESASLRSQLSNRADSFSFREEPELAALVASVGIQREILTVSNELAPYLLCENGVRALQPGQVMSELVRLRKSFGVRVWAKDEAEFEIRLRGLRALANPTFSVGSNGRYKQLVFFPESIAKIIEHEGAELVIVPQWGLNTIFGGFDGETHYYQTNLWELDNNDTLRFARLLEKKQIPLLGTHDLTAHISGVRGERVEHLARLGKRVRMAIESYFQDVRGEQRSRASLIIPYLIGVFLDDLAQPANYGSQKHERVIEELLSSLEARAVDPSQKQRIVVFPKSFKTMIDFTRNSDEATVFEHAHSRVRQLVDEIYRGTVRATG